MSYKYVGRVEGQDTHSNRRGLYGSADVICVIGTGGWLP
jgi:hypothetical protein